MTEVCKCIYPSECIHLCTSQIAEENREREKRNELFFFFDLFFFSLALSVIRLLSSLIQPASKFRFTLLLSPFSRLFFHCSFIPSETFRCHIYKVIIALLFFFVFFSLVRRVILPLDYQTSFTYTLLTIVLDRCQIMCVQHTIDSIRLLISACLISLITITYLTSSIKCK